MLGELKKKCNVHTGTDKYRNFEDAYLNFIKTMEILVFAKLNCESGGGEGVVEEGLSCKFLKASCCWLD